MMQLLRIDSLRPLRLPGENLGFSMPTTRRRDRTVSKPYTGVNLALLAALLIALPATAADAQQGLLACRGIAEEGPRLACYDALAAPTVAAPAPTAPAAPAPPASPAVPAPLAAAVKAPEQSFGAETVKKAPTQGEPEVERIQSRLMGSYDTWSKGARYKLENGQVWLNIDDRERYLSVENPTVTIERNFIGSYWMRVGNSNAPIRVRRVQ